MPQINNTRDYTITSALYKERDTNSTPIDLQNMIVQFVIYEHIFKPYLTAKFMFMDQHDILGTADHQGGETFEIEFENSEEVGQGRKIRKEFLIDKIESVHKVNNDKDEMVTMHCTEIHALHSSLLNVNRTYFGSVTGMIRRIMDNYLKVNVKVDGSNINNDLKVLIPNLNPLEACMFLLPRALTLEGMPFYFYSTLGAENLVLKDLGTMLEEDVVNRRNPYIYSKALLSDDTRSDDYSIEDFEFDGTEDLLGIIRKGLVGSKFIFHSLLTGVSDGIEFDVDNDMFQPLKKFNKIGVRNNRYNYAPDYKYDAPLLGNKAFNQHRPRTITEISAGAAFRNYEGDFSDFNEHSNPTLHKSKIISQSVNNFIAKSPLSITVKSREFLKGDDNHTLGRSLRIQFLDSKIDGEAPMLDRKKSGDYLIFATQHMFTGNRARTRLLLGRLGHLGVQTAAG